MDKLRLGIFYAMVSILLFGCSHTNEAKQDFIAPKRPPSTFGQRQKHLLVYPPKGPKALVIVDPGHGGKDLGTHSEGPSFYEEKALTLATAKILDGALRKLGYATLMTRDSDNFISLEDRAWFANQKHADLFVSVHYNSAPSKSAEGIEVYYYQNDKDKPRAEFSKKLAASVEEHLQVSTEAKSRGVKHGNYAVIRETTMPAILVEGGFLTNNKELARIKDEAYMRKLAWAIAKGVDHYWEIKKNNTNEIALAKSTPIKTEAKKTAKEIEQEYLLHDLKLPKGKPQPTGRPLPKAKKAKTGRGLPSGTKLPKGKSLPKSDFEAKFGKTKNNHEKMQENASK